MKILVFDDNPLHRKAAEVTLKGHELTIVGTYDEAQAALVPKGGRAPDFDVVLTDLMVFPSAQAQADKLKFAREEMPLGTTIALLALYAGIKNVAVVTDTSHHEHPASAAFDCFRQNESRAQGFRLLCTGRVGCIFIDKATGELLSYDDVVYSDEGRKKYGSNPWASDLLDVGGKDWGKVLEELMENPTAPSATAEEQTGPREVDVSKL